MKIVKNAVQAQSLKDLRAQIYLLYLCQTFEAISHEA